MNTRRNRLELIYDILLAIQTKGGQIKPTHLMYKSNLSHKLLTKYIEELIEKEFIEVKETIVKKRQQPVKSIYLAPKGIEFIVEYRKMQQFTQAFGL